MFRESLRVLVWLSSWVNLHASRILRLAPSICPMTQSAIAERLAIPLGTVKTRLRLALGRLRISLASVREWVL